MDVRFVTPLGALFTLTALVVLAVFVRRRRRLSRIRKALGLPPQTLRSQLTLVVALAAVPVLLGIAAAQPVIETTRTVRERTDAQAFVVVDVSRSMIAGAGPGAPRRFDRAREIALGLQEALPEVPFGVASLTDRVLPHLFPTVDGPVFASTLTRSLEIEQPPPGGFYLTVATNLNSLRLVPEKNYFPPSAKKRVLVVLTDGESQALEPDLARAFRKRPRVETIFVHLWDADERIYETGVEEGGYQPDPGSSALLGRAAALVGGQVIPESDAGNLVGAVRGLIAEGETVARQAETGRLALMPYVTLLALVPLAFVLLRRNVWARSLRRAELPKPGPRRLPSARTVREPA
jgi:von Willebrand factor type A domain